MKLNNTQISVFVIILALTITLYFLPKKVLTNNKEGATRDKPATENGPAAGTPGAELKPVLTILNESISELPETEQKSLEAKTEMDAASLKKLLANYKKKDNKLGIAWCMENLKDEYKTQEIGMAYYAAFNQSEKDDNRKAIAAKTIEYIKPLSESNPSDLELKCILADCYVNTSDNPMSGIMILREVMAKDSTNESALFLLGQFAVKSGQMDKAIQRFESLVRYYPDNIKYSLYLAQLFSGNGDKEKALETLTHAKKYAVRKSAIDSINNSINHLK